MPGKDDVRLRRRSAFRLWSAAFLLFELALRLLFETHWLDSRPLAQAVVLVVAGLVTVVWIWKAIVEYRQRRRDRLEARATGRWPMGRPHLVALDARCDGSRVAGTLVFETAGLRVDPAPDLVPDVIPYADVATVRVRSAWIEVETREWTFRVVPSSYEERQHLLWEFALNSNEAVERGIDDESAKGAQSPSSAAHVADATDLPNLGSGIPGLGSALAGPMDRGNRPPPRKSGLGVGLFNLPPGDEA